MRIPRDVGRLYKDAGAHLAGELVCRCGKRVPVTPGDAAIYLQHGWPVHCGQTMTFHQRKRAPA